MSRSQLAIAIAVGVASAVAAVLRRRKQRRQPVFLFFGEAFVDVMVSGLNKLPEWNKDILTEQPIQLQAGGSALNTAVHLAAAGSGAVELRTATAADDFGRLLVGEGRRRGVDVVQLEVRGGSAALGTGCCVVLSGCDDRAFATHRGVADAMCISQADVDAAVAVGRRGGHVHVAGYYNCGRLQAGVPRLLLAARAAGAVTSLGTQTDALDEWAGLVNTPLLAECLDFLIVSEDEAYGIASVNGLVPRDGATGPVHARAVATALLRAEVSRCVVVTRGAAGALLVSAKTYLEQPAPRASCVTDATGAGDAFIAGFLHGYREQPGSLRTALRYGCAFGACCVAVVGASAPLDGKEIQAAFEATFDADAPDATL